MDDRPTVKLADFGLAKILSESEFASTHCGTPDYLAPEVHQSSPGRPYTEVVDMWSLGVVLYVILCGFPPFSEQLNTPGNPYPMMQQILWGRFTYVEQFWGGIDDMALNLIDGLLCVNPNARLDVDQFLEHRWMTMATRPTGQSQHDHQQHPPGGNDHYNAKKKARYAYRPEGGINFARCLYESLQTRTVGSEHISGLWTYTTGFEQGDVDDAPLYSSEERNEGFMG